MTKMQESLMRRLVAFTREIDAMERMLNDPMLVEHLDDQDTKRFEDMELSARRFLARSYRTR